MYEKHIAKYSKIASIYFSPSTLDWQWLRTGNKKDYVEINGKIVLLPTLELLYVEE